MVLRSIGILALTLLALDIPGAAAERPVAFKDLCGATETVREPWRESVLARRAGWLEKAEAAKPRLFRRDVAPVGLVKPVEDASTFQGWRAAAAGRTASSAVTSSAGTGSLCIVSGFLRLQERVFAAVERFQRLLRFLRFGEVGGVERFR